jgi:hypothetical protein
MLNINMSQKKKLGKNLLETTFAHQLEVRTNRHSTLSSNIWQATRQTANGLLSILYE